MLVLSADISATAVELLSLIVQNGAAASVALQFNVTADTLDPLTIEPLVLVEFVVIDAHPAPHVGAAPEEENVVAFKVVNLPVEVVVLPMGVLSIEPPVTTSEPTFTPALVPLPLPPVVPKANAKRGRMKRIKAKIRGFFI